jgi:hypothetical protein
MRLNCIKLGEKSVIAKSYNKDYFNVNFHICEYFLT